MSGHTWDITLDYLRLIGTHDVAGATDLLTASVDAEGIGAINDALADVCRSLMDRIIFPAGTIDIHAAVDRIALRVVELSRDERPGALDRLRSLIVFLGSEGLPCAARDDVASWEPADRLHDSVACTLGLLGIVAGVEGSTTVDVVANITPPRRAVAPEGTFEETCSLRSILAGVAMLRDSPQLIEQPTTAILRSSS